MKVITIGAATLDIFLQSQQFKTLKDPHFRFRAGFPLHTGLCFPLGEKIELTNAYFSLGGGVLNAASTLAQAGLTTTATFKLGRDLIGEQILTLLRSAHFAKHFKLYQGQGNFSIIALSQEGERVIFVYRDQKTRWRSRQLPQATNGFFYITPGDTSVQIWLKFFKQLKQKNNILACNPSADFLAAKKELIKKAFAFLDVLLVNKEEAEKILGQEDSDQAVCRSLQQIAPRTVIVVTLGERGVTVCSQGDMFYSPGFKAKKVADMTGAGDAFGSAFCGALVKNNFFNPPESASTPQRSALLKEAIRWGCANAVAVIEKLGAQAGILAEKDYQNLRFRKLRIEKLE